RRDTEPTIHAGRQFFEGGARPRFAHHADPRIGLTAASKRHRPPKSSSGDGSSEIDLDLIGERKGHLALRAVHEQSRQSEAETPVEPIVCAAGNDACAPEHSAGAGGDVY